MKKIFYYLIALLFISVEFVFCQPDVCQSQLIPEEHKLFKSLLSIVEDIKAAKENSENLNLKDYLLESGKNSDTVEGIINELPPLFEDAEEMIHELPPLFEDKIFYEISITPLAANLKADTGEVSCKLILTNEDGSNSEYFLLMKFVKQLNNWILADNEYNHRFLAFLDEKYTPQQLDAITTFTVRESDKTFIRYRIKSDPEIWELNKNVTWFYMERWLFANQSPIDVDVYQFENNWPYTTAAFYLDPYWHRIVYSKYNSSDIKAFDIEYYSGAQFPSEPCGITIDDWGKIYIADKRNNDVIKLVYIPSANSVYFSSKLNIPGLDGPTDVVYSSHTTPKNSTDDYLLIANKQARNIIKTSLNGTVLNTVTRFKTGGVYYNFISPSRITQVPGTTYIAVIDEAFNYLIVGTIQESNTLVCHNVIKFNSAQHPTDVGVNCFGDLLVTDNNKAIHKFTYIGIYLCTYSSNSFNFPQRISRVNDQLYYIFDQASSESWSATNGIKRFIPGSDVFSLSVTQYPTNYRCLFTLSDFSKVKIEIINSSNQVIKTINYDYMTSGRQEATIPLSEIPCCGTYKFRVKHKPLYDENYGGYEQGWRYSEIQFNTSPVVEIIGPTSAQRYTTSTFTCSTNAQGATYLWEEMPICCTLAPNCGEYNYIGNGSSLSIYNTGYHYYLRLKVTSGPYTAQDVHYVNVEYCIPNGGGGGCPTLAFDVGGEMTDDNPLLITSLSNPGVDVTDYYLLQNPVTPVGNKINLRIHEPQTEHTWLNYVELIEAEVKSDELVAVNDEGEIINYKKLSTPVTVLLNGTTDITEILAGMDTLEITLLEGDVLTVQRNSLSAGDGEDEDFVVGGIDPIKNHESITLSLAKKDDNNEDNPRFGGIFLRPNKSIMAKKLRNLPPGDIEIVINKTLTLDYLTIAKNIKTAKVKSLDLLSANHSTAGNVKALLSGIDQNYAEIIPVETIDLEFQKGNTPAEKTAYILKSVGRYETDTTLIMNKPTGIAEENIIPKENKLFDNYPNPFNPATQIKYSVKENGMVTLKVYDVLGNEVATLVNEEKQAGTYTVTFDAGKMASGIYFYSITANDYQKTKKMLLIK